MTIAEPVARCGAAPTPHTRTSTLGRCRHPVHTDAQLRYSLPTSPRVQPQHEAVRLVLELRQQTGRVSLGVGGGPCQSLALAPNHAIVLAFARGSMAGST
jgi:hypothetical protein